MTFKLMLVGALAVAFTGLGAGASPAAATVTFVSASIEAESDIQPLAQNYHIPAYGFDHSFLEGALQPLNAIANATYTVTQHGVTATATANNLDTAAWTSAAFGTISFVGSTSVSVSGATPSQSGSAFAQTQGEVYTYDFSTTRAGTISISYKTVDTTGYFYPQYVQVYDTASLVTQIGFETGPMGSGFITGSLVGDHSYELKIFDEGFVDYVVQSGNGAESSTRNDQFAFNIDSAVPEPASWAMMLVGFGAIGALLRSPRHRPAVAA